MSAGNINVPIVFRGPNGDAAGVGAQHSQVFVLPSCYHLSKSFTVCLIDKNILEKVALLVGGAIGAKSCAKLKAVTRIELMKLSIF